MNAIDLLENDHQRVEALFRDFEAAGADAATRHDLAQFICLELTVHTSLEEELFYPAFRQATGDQQLVQEALREHGTAKELIRKIQSAGPDHALVAELRREVEHHVSEERQKIFPKARGAGLDLDGLGAQLEARKAELAATQAA